jgi:hypothetical protein
MPGTAVAAYQRLRDNAPDTQTPGTSSTTLAPTGGARPKEPKPKHSAAISGLLLSDPDDEGESGRIWNDDQSDAYDIDLDDMQTDEEASMMPNAPLRPARQNVPNSIAPTPTLPPAPVVSLASGLAESMTTEESNRTDTMIERHTESLLTGAQGLSTQTTENVGTPNEETVPRIPINKRTQNLIDLESTQLFSDYYDTAPESTQSQEDISTSTKGKSKKSNRSLTKKSSTKQNTSTPIARPRRAKNQTPHPKSD